MSLLQGQELLLRGGTSMKIIKEAKILSVSLVEEPLHPEWKIQYLRKVEDIELPEDDVRPDAE